ncbi:hypothetical protein RCL1_003333 [Eukaryota sp. TZLM3-RCL]
MSSSDEFVPRKRTSRYIIESDEEPEEEPIHTPSVPSPVRPRLQHLATDEDKLRRRRERMEELLRERQELLDEPVSNSEDEEGYDSEGDGFVVAADGRPISMVEEDSASSSLVSSIFDYTRLNLPMPPPRGRIQQVEDEEEPMETAETFMAGEDWPDRLIKKESSDGEIFQEAIWIKDKLCSFVDVSVQNNDILIEPIVAVLSYILLQGREPVVVAKLLTEKLKFRNNQGNEKVLTEEDVHKIMEFDEEWTRIKVGQNRLKRLFELHSDIDLMLAVQNIQSLQSLIDYNDIFELKYGSQIGPKASVRSSAYTKAKNMFLASEGDSLLDFGRVWCLKPSEFYDNLAGNSFHYPHNVPAEPLDAVRHYEESEEKAKKLLDLVCTALAVELASTPQIREHFRPIFHPKIKESLRSDPKIITFNNFNIEEYQRSFLSLEVMSSFGHDWNEKRKQVLHDMFHRFLFPLFLKEVKNEAQKERNSEILSEISVNFDKIAKQGIAAGEIMAIYLGDPTEPCVFSHFDEYGALIESQIFTEIHLRITKFTSQEVKNRRAEEWSKVAEFVAKHEPSNLFVGIKGWETQDFLKMFEEKVVLSPGVSLHLLPSDIPRVYANSPTTTLLYPEFDSNLRFTIGLARFAQDALNMLCFLAKTKSDILSLSFHPDQKSINSEILYKNLCKILVSNVANVGVDLSQAVRDDYYSSLLAFIPGLSFRSVELLKNRISEEGFSPVTRHDLLKYKVLGPILYENVAPFIYIPNSSDVASTRLAPSVNAQERTYFSPLSYEELVTLMLGEPLEEGDVVSGTVVGFGPDNALKADVSHPPMKDTPEFQLFLRDVDLVKTNENEARLETDPESGSKYAGRKKFDFAIIKLDSGPRARLYKTTLPVDQRQEYIDDVIILGTVLSVKVTKFDYHTPRYDDEMGHVSQQTLKIDVELINSGQDEVKLEEEQTSRRTYILRPIQHSHFKNLTYSQSEEYLQNQEIGSCVFRPASGNDLTALTLSMKFSQDSIMHIRLLSTHSKSKPNTLLLGDKITVKPWFSEALERSSKWDYASLDEVMVNFVDRFFRHVKEVIFHSKFVSTVSSADNCFEILKAQSAANPGFASYMISYYFIDDKKEPGIFGLYYHLNGDRVKERILVTHEGFTFRNAPFKTIFEVLKYFKMNTSMKSHHMMAPPSVSYSANYYPL